VRVDLKTVLDSGRIERPGQLNFSANPALATRIIIPNQLGHNHAQ